MFSIFNKILFSLNEAWEQLDKILFNWWLNFVKQDVKKIRTNSQKQAPIVFVGESKFYKFFFNNDCGWPTRYSFFLNERLNSYYLEVRPYETNSERVYNQIFKTLQRKGYTWNCENPIKIISTSTTTPVVNEMIINLHSEYSHLKMFDTIVSINGNHKGIELYDHVRLCPGDIFSQMIKQMNFDSKFIEFNSVQKSSKRIKRIEKILSNVDYVKQVYIVQESVLAIPFLNNYDLYIPLQIKFNPLNNIYNICLFIFYSINNKRTNYFAQEGFSSTGIRCKNQVINTNKCEIYYTNKPACIFFETWYQSLELQKLLRAV